MRKLIIICHCILLNIALYAQKVEWVKTATPHTITTPDAPFTFKKIIPDGTGNFYAFGTLKAQTNYNGTVLTPINAYPGANLNNTFVMKLDTSGNVLWHKILAKGISNNFALDIASTLNNRLTVLLDATTDIIINTDTIAVTNPGGAPFQAVLAVFENNGAYVGMASNFMPAGESFQKIYWNNNSLYILGQNKIWKWNSTLALQWQITTGTLYDYFSDLNFLSNGNVVAVGIDGTQGPGGLTVDTIVHSTSQSFLRNFYVMINASTGHALWLNVLGSTTAMGALNQVEIDNADNIYMSGWLGFNNMLFYFGTDTIGSPGIASNSGPAFILKADANGNPLWARDFYANSIGLSQNAYQKLLALDDSANVYLFPKIVSNILLKPGQQPYFNYTNPGGVCFIKVNSSGVVQYGKSYNNTGAAQTDGNFTGAAFLNGNMYVVGNWVGNGANEMKLGCHRVSDAGYFMMISKDNEPVPQAGFDFVMDEGKAYFTNNTLNGDSIYSWDFGNGQTSAQVNPSYQYTTPGSYNVCLTAESLCGVDTVCRNVVNQGIERVNPNRISQNGFHMLFIHGGFPTITNGTVKLIKTGRPDIIPDTVFFISNSVIKVNINLTNADLGGWDIVINSTIFNDTLTNGVTIEVDNYQIPELQIQIPSATLVNRFGICKLKVSNNGNKTLIGVPVYVTLNYQLNGDLMTKVLTDTVINLLTNYPSTNFNLHVDTLSNDSITIGFFLIPVLMPNSSIIVSFSYISPQTGLLEIAAGTNKPMLDSAVTNFRLGYFNRSQKAMSGCGFPPCLECLMDIAGYVPAVGCVTNSLQWGCSIGNIINSAIWDDGKLGSNVVDAFGTSLAVVFSCAGAPEAQVWYKYESAVAQALTRRGKWGAGLVATLEFKDIYDKLDHCDPFFALGLSDDPGCIPQIDAKMANIVGSLDPNTKTGPIGHNSFNYIKGDEKYNYTIHFENADTALAPATEVTVIDTIDKNLIDLSTISFTEFGFGDSLYSISENKNAFVREIDLTPAKNIILRVNGSVDTTSGILTCRFSSFDPVTMALTDSVSEGFLPPNINYPEGEGFVSFSYKLKPGLSHQQAINNKATIVFDNNAPITTPAWLNTIDIVKPTSSILPLAVGTIDTIITLHINGVDADAGISHYDIYVSVDDTAYFRLASNFAGDSIKVIGEYGKKYEFFSIATDHAGNIEDPPVDPDNFPDAVTTITVGAQELSNPIEIKVVPNPATNSVSVSLHSHVNLNCRVEVMDLQGRIVFSNTIAAKENHTTVRINTSLFNSGMYYIRVSDDSFSHTEKLMIMH